MRAIFRIKYNTEWGQNLFLVARDKKYPMKWGEGAVWSVTIPKFTLADLEDYTYVVMRDGCIERRNGIITARKCQKVRLTECSMTNGWSVQSKDALPARTPGRNL